ncbi:MAG: HXXEE domain-containing protein [Ignavibacteriae bacterium]|nr:HXXEE domain-containing protein [Ignavibacteriota bacterium]
MSKQSTHSSFDETQMKVELVRPLVKFLLAAPVVFVLHVIEESPGFVEWFNAHVNPDITEGVFWSVNAYGLVITLVVCAYEWYAASAVSLLAVMAWFSMLMLANGAFHILSAALDNAYTPGVITATVLYIPYYFVLMMKVAQAKRVSFSILAGAAIVGSIPMVLHGYLILFEGSRLF